MGIWYTKNKHNILIVYELLMLIMILISLITVFVSTEPKPFLQMLNRVVWAVFLVDVILRIIKSVSKWGYIKKNPFDIVSVIPFEDIFLLARFARVIKLFRYKNILKRYLVKIDSILVQHHIIKITTYTLTLMLVVVLVVYSITGLTIYKSLEWVGMNFVKFNYFSEYTETNKVLVVLSVITKVIGIVYIGVLLNDIRHRLIEYYKKYKEYKEYKEYKGKEDKGG